MERYSTARLRTLDTRPIVVSGAYGTLELPSFAADLVYPLDWLHARDVGNTWLWNPDRTD
jgi:hypothetical protein